MAQEQMNTHSGGGSDEEGTGQEAGQVNVNTAGTDDLLDEIDSAG